MKIVDKVHKADVTVDAPPSKAHTLRALIISSLADGKSTIYNPLLGQDQLNVIECLKRLGVKIESAPADKNRSDTNFITVLIVAPADHMDRKNTPYSFTV